METEGSSAIAQKPQGVDILAQAEAVAKKAWEKTEPLPSEKVDPFTPDRIADMQTQEFLLWLPKGRAGFRFNTDQSLTANMQGLTDQQKLDIKHRTAGQMVFAQGNLAKQALDAYRANPSEENKKAYEAARTNYLDRLSPKVGVRNVRLSGDSFTIDTMPVSFQANAVLGKFTESQQNLERGTISATSGNVIFAPEKDGKRKMGLMLRSAKNGNWRNVPGTMIAGYFDGSMNEKPSKHSPKQGRRTLQAVDNRAIIANGLKELHEETGIEARHMKGSRISGLAVEKKTRAHHEFLVDIELKINATQAKEISDKFVMDHPQEFKEDWVAVDYTPEVFENLLTKVLCPLPDSHYASYAATGKRLVAETKGEKAAEEWFKKLEIGISENRERINATVRKYLRDNPEVMTQPTPSQMEKIEADFTKFKGENPQANEEDLAKKRQELIDGRTKFNPDGFNPAMLPEEQGLPDVVTALKMGGVIPQDMVVKFPADKK